MRKRGFEIVSAYAGKEVELPNRKTGGSAGYDIAAAEDIVVMPRQIALVPTGLKAYMQPDEYLGIHMRSGFSVRHRISCVNNEGIIDSDYYNNEENEGHIFVAVLNHGEEQVEIPKGTRIAQGIFYKFLVADDDMIGAGPGRSGGFGSTGA